MTEREVRIDDYGVHVASRNDAERWNSDVTVQSTEAGTRVRVGDVELFVTGNTTGTAGRLSFKDRELWSGDYTGQASEA